MPDWMSCSNSRFYLWPPIFQKISNFGGDTDSVSLTFSCVLFFIPPFWFYFQSFLNTMTKTTPRKKLKPFASINQQHGIRFKRAKKHWGDGPPILVFEQMTSEWYNAPVNELLLEFRGATRWSSSMPTKVHMDGLVSWHVGVAAVLCKIVESHCTLVHSSPGSVASFTTPQEWKLQV